MDCARFDWKGYALGELSATETAACERHLNSCEQCRAEVARWRTTVASLRNLLPDVEPPRRIVFAAEPVAPEPVLTDPWWRRVWNSGPQLGFASAMVLAVALVAHGALTRTPTAPAPMTAAQLDARTQARIHEEALKEVNRLLPQVVDAALRDAANRQVGEQLQPALASFKREMNHEEQLREAAAAERRDADQKAVRYAFERLERRITYATLSAVRTQGGE